MGNKSSWRLKWIDIDSSFTIQQPEEGAIKGYMVVRSPKGTKEAKLFPRGNADAIRAYVGLETANFPDIAEAIAFNREYDLYLSCPPGSSAEYPSYLGGMYLTSDGLKPFYNVTSKDTVDFTQNKEFNTDEFGSDISVRLVGNPSCEPNKSDFAYVISGIKSDKWGNLQELGLNYWGEESLGIPAAMYYYYINKADHKVYIEDEDGIAITEKYCGVWYKGTGGYTVIIGGEDWLTKMKNEPMYWEFFGEPIAQSLGLQTVSSQNTTDDTTIPYFTIDSIRKNAKILALKVNENIYNIPSSESGDEEPYVIGDKTTTPYYTTNKALWLELLKTINCSWTPKSVDTDTDKEWTSEYQDYTAFISYLKETANKSKIYANGYVTISLPYESEDSFLPESFSVKSSTSDGTLSYYELGKGQVNINSITGLVNIKDTVYGYIMQKYPTETPTTVTFENIGYDKYIYDESIVGLEYVEGTTVATTYITQEFYQNLYPNNLFIFYKENSQGDYKSFGRCIYHFDENLFDKLTEDGSTAVSLLKCCTEVQLKQVSKRFLVGKNFDYTGSSASNAAYTEDNSSDNTLTDKILFVQSRDKIYVQKEESDDSNLELKKDVNYNTITFSCSEEVFPGQITSGGTITGSLDEKGKDASGSNIYFPNVLNEDDFSFVDFVPIKTFDEDVNKDGIFEKTRIVDDQLSIDKMGNTVGTTKKIVLKGQRYISEVVNQNVKDGVVGGAWRDEFYGAVSQGWDEAFSQEYDDVYIFMDPTGQEFVHTQHASLVQLHKLAIAISPKLITKAEFNNVSQITVTGRHQQCAEYVGEFKVYDSYTGQYYWCNPIGDVGLNLARIYDLKLGGWAPAWFNYGGVGGQLNRSVIASKWKFSDKDTEILDKKGINPIVYNKDDGLMIVSQKTLQDPNNLTDWGYLGHVMSFLLCKREIRDTIMRPQLMKPIDDFWFEVRQEQLDTVLNRRLTGSTRIWTDAKGEVASVNNDNTKLQRKFCLKARVKVTPFSEYVELSFENVSSTTVL